MRPIDKFILHVVHNWTDELNEAYSEKAIKAFVEKFKAQADRYKYSITPEELTALVKRFDEMSTNNPKIKDKDLSNYDVRELVRLVRSKKGTKEPEEKYNITPDVVYNENGLIIYNGSKEENCLRYGAGEEWCITRTSFGNYRFDDNRKNPTFYLVRDTNQVVEPGDTTSDAYRKSFFVVVVGNDNTYKVSDRTNNDVGGRQTEWDRWEPWSFVESNFPSVRGLRSVFEYIPLSKTEKESEVWKKRSIPIEEWEDLPYDTKIIYLVRRKGNKLFTDINNDEFITNPEFLASYPDIAQYIAENAGIIDSLTLVKHLNVFSKISNQTVKSIIANLRDKIDIKYLNKEYARIIPFNVKVFLLEKDKWDIPSDDRLYLVKDKKGNNIIVKLTIGNDIILGLYREKSTDPDIELDKETAPYLLAYPDLDKIPFDNLMKLASKGIITKDIINKTIEKAKTDENSAIIVKTIDDKEIIVDSNSFAAYKIENGKVSKIPFESEEAQNVVAQEENNTSFQQNAVKLIEDGVIPNRIDKDSFISIIKNTPYETRTFTKNRHTDVILVPEGNSRYSLFTRHISELMDGYANVTYGGSGPEDWNRYDTRNSMDESMWKAYFTYLRSKNDYYTDDQLLYIINSSNIYRDVKKDFIKAKPPISTNGIYAPGELNNRYYLVNKTNSRQSVELSDSRDRAKRANLTPSEVRQILGTPEPPTPPTPTRLTPAQMGAGEQVPAPLPRTTQAVPAVQAENNAGRLIAAAGLTAGFSDLPPWIQQRIQTGTVANPRLERSARSRDAELGTRGTVTGVIVNGTNKMFIIQLASGRNIAQVSVQPEARHYIVTVDTAFNMGRVNNFINSLNQRNLTENIRNYLKKNPHRINEVRKLIKQYINETKKY